MMKNKLLALGLALVLLLSLTACGATDIIGSSQPATQGESSADVGTSSPETTQPETEENLLTEEEAKTVCETLLRDAYDLLHFLHCDMYTDETDSFEVEVEYILRGETHKRTMGYSLITTYEQRGIYTLDDVRIALEKIYTPETAVETGLFAQPSYSNEVAIKERDGKLYYRNATKGWFGSYVPDSLQILSVTKDTVEMKISIISGPQPEILGDFTYTIKNTENGWRLDTHYTDGWIWPAGE